MKSFSERMKEEARLLMLQALKRQATGQLAVRTFSDVLELDGHNYSPDWIRTELRALAELELVSLITVGGADFSIVQLTDRGDLFLRRKIVVEGVKRPSYGDPF